MMVTIYTKVYRKNFKDVTIYNVVTKFISYSTFKQNK